MKTITKILQQKKISELLLIISKYHIEKNLGQKEKMTQFGDLILNHFPEFSKTKSKFPNFMRTINSWICSTENYHLIMILPFSTSKMNGHFTPGIW